MKTVYYADSFTDYRGLTRNFIMAAVSEDVDVDATEYDMEDPNDTGLELSIPRAVSIGIAVCRPCDKFDPEIGKKIAQGKAIKYRDHTIYASDPGMINEEVVNALLKQESEYFKQNPGRYLAGYDKDMSRFLERKRIEDLEASLSDDGKALLASLENSTELDEVIEVFNARQ